MTSSHKKTADLQVGDARADDSALIADTLERGFAWLRFPPALESAYDQDRHRRLLPRAIAIGWYALGIHLAYSLSDYLLLPEVVYPFTIAIRLLIMCPLIAYLIWVSYRSWSARAYLCLYAFGYLVSGLSIIAIILVARLQQVPIPYEGLLVLMMFGYLLLAIPFYHVLLVSAFLFSAYVLAEWLAGYPLESLIFNSFFLFTANVIGAVGCYLQEQAQRRNYLNQCLVEISRDTAQAQSDSKTLLLATASHDLRQPLHAMTLFAENLEQNLPDGEAKTTARHLQSSILQLNQLLESLLDISRLQVGIVEPQFKHFDPGPVIEQVVLESQRDGVTKIRINNHLAGQQAVFSDSVLFARMLRNLIENAMEHARATVVSVDVTLRAETVEISVRDNGKGIPAEALDTIFEAFHQLDSAPETGLGLGLAIVKQMANLLRIELEVSSVEDHGTIFTIRLPKGNQAVLRDFQDNQNISQTQCGGRILMIEDSPNVLSSASALVGRWGYQVDCAASVDEGLALLARGQYHVVISDYHFQEGVNGDSFVRSMRRQGYDLPVMILTADTHVQLDDSELMPVLVCYKPLKPARFRMALNHLFARRVA